MALRRGQNAKLPPEQEEALLVSLRLKRESVARAKLQSEAQAVARKLGDMEVEKVAVEAAALAAKDRKNFGSEQQSAVATITLNAVLFNSSAPKDDDGGKGGKGKGGAKAKAKAASGKKGAKPKIGAKVEILPPPTCDEAIAAIVSHKDTLKKVSTFTDGQLSLLRAFEGWLLLELNEALLPDTQKLLQVLRDEGLVEQEVFMQYWAAVQATLEGDGPELRAAQEQCQVDGKDHADSVEKLKAAETEMEDVKHRVKWAEIEALNARCGNQPSEQEAAREKAANLANTAVRTLKLKQTKVVEMCHKRQVTSLNAREASDRILAEKTKEMRPVELMNLHARSFFEGKDGAPNKEMAAGYESKDVATAPGNTSKADGAD